MMRAPLLGYTGKRAVQTVSNMECGRVPIAESARLLIGAYLDGYRPDDWPATHEKAGR